MSDIDRTTKLREIDAMMHRRDQLMTELKQLNQRIDDYLESLRNDIVSEDIGALTHATHTAQIHRPKIDVAAQEQPSDKIGQPSDKIKVDSDKIKVNKIKNKSPQNLERLGKIVFTEYNGAVNIRVKEIKLVKDYIVSHGHAKSAEIQEILRESLGIAKGTAKMHAPAIMRHLAKKLGWSIVETSTGMWNVMIRKKEH